jgi:hypothetical protein
MQAARSPYLETLANLRHIGINVRAKDHEAASKTLVERCIETIESNEKTEAYLEACDQECSQRSRLVQELLDTTLFELEWAQTWLEACDAGQLLDKLAKAWALCDECPEVRVHLAAYVLTKRLTHEHEVQVLAMAKVTAVLDRLDALGDAELAALQADFQLVLEAETLQKLCEQTAQQVASAVPAEVREDAQKAMVCALDVLYAAAKREVSEQPEVERAVVLAIVKATADYFSGKLRADEFRVWEICDNAVDEWENNRQAHTRDASPERTSKK